VKLFQLQMRKESSYVTKNLPRSPLAELNYNHLDKHPLINNRGGKSFREDVLFAVLAATFLDEGDIRSQLAFEDSLKNNKSYMVGFANEIGKLVVDIMERLSSIKKLLDHAGTQKEAVADVKEQLGLLIYSGFIRHLPLSQLKAIPRYLKTIEYRLEKRKDEKQAMQQLNRYWKRYWTEVATKSNKEIVIPEYDKFRWDLEELRVSLFAQQLKTAYPISAKRMDKAWDERF